MKYIMALDGGGSKLLCLVSDEYGNLCGYSTSGPTNSHFNSEQEIEQSISQAIEQALLRNNIQRVDITAVYWAMPVIHQFVHDTIIKWTHPHVAVHNCEEYHLSLYAAIQEEYGAICVAGTGSFTMTHTKKFGARYVGGWGSIFGDEGSGYSIGCKAFAACTYMSDQIGPFTSLLEKILTEFQFDNLRNLLFYIHGLQKGDQRKRIASICRIVGLSAAEGDIVAINILKDAAIMLANQTIQTLRLDQSELYQGFPLTISGGVWKAHPLLYQTFAKMVKQQQPQIEVFQPLFEPVVGGILIGLRERNFPIKHNIGKFKQIYADYLIDK
ncbi:hypothetical protein EHS13_34990 [Paenibacillus psychroresistens]|uniref:ATPase BadF/BadG/BcrA/BcrD type domain-containing protein n=1 Tax=Paenibacillus psychroresistens TaxID=1778678 RepID=A0A6B8RTH7_9BACL|nr:BadF/BadG/BcrA/BcrD ATPase family protein [Paenibacillus psychroresistens]QGQ99701.1 hypothetical protein EHS13_34990 [Paenibacillus psychroresistens]